MSASAVGDAELHHFPYDDDNALIAAARLDSHDDVARLIAEGEPVNLFSVRAPGRHRSRQRLGGASFG